MTPDQIADVLDDAADYIEKHGWMQGGFQDPAGRVCVLGALNSVTSGSAVWPTVQGTTASVALLEATEADGVTTWNDAPGRTKQEVLDAFRAAAKQQRSLP